MPTETEKLLIKLRNLQIARIKKLRYDLEAEEAQLKQLEENIESVKANVPIEKQKNIEITKLYDPAMKWEKKVIYVLYKLKQAPTTDIVEEISKLDNVDPKTIYEVVQQVMIRMIKKKFLIKIGDYKSTYKLSIGGK